MHSAIKLERKYGTRHYGKRPVVFVSGQGIYLWDSDGKQYIDAMACYSAANHGHGHARIKKVVREMFRADTKALPLVSGSFYHPWLGPLQQKLVEITGQDRALIMNTGAEAVETAIKIARKYGRKVKKIKPDCAEIIVCEGNFHGRTTGATGLSSKESYRKLFGPFASGTTWVPYGDHKALDKAITDNTVLFLCEPIQGEGGINVPPPGYLTECTRICREHEVLFVADEIQTGLGRTGKMFACNHEGVKPDMMLLGKSLGGGSGIPVSAVVGRDKVMDILDPGEHGSTFGGTALACRVALEAIDILLDEGLTERSAELGAYFLEQLRELKSPYITGVRGRGLFVGIEIDLKKISASKMCNRLLENGVVTQDAHGVIRLTPPLIIEKEEINELVHRVGKAFDAKGF